MVRSVTQLIDTIMKLVSWNIFQLERAPVHDNLIAMSAITQLKALSVSE